VTAADLARAIARSETVAASLRRSRERLAPLCRLDAAGGRNRLAHVHPDDPGRQPGRLNRAFATAAAALDAVRSVQGWARREGILPPA
jgi:hypothetical protein